MPRGKVQVREYEGWYGNGDCNNCPLGRQPDGTPIKFNCVVRNRFGELVCPPDTEGNPAGVFGRCMKHTCQGKDGPCHCQCSTIPEKDYESPCPAKIPKPTPDAGQMYGEAIGPGIAQM